MNKHPYPNNARNHRYVHVSIVPERPLRGNDPTAVNGRGELTRDLRPSFTGELLRLLRALFLLCLLYVWLKLNAPPAGLPPEPGMSYTDEEGVWYPALSPWGELGLMVLCGTVAVCVVWWGVVLWR